MAEILSKFFQIAAILTVMILTINMAIIAFGEPLTGETYTISLSTNLDKNASDYNITGTSVQQTGSLIDTPTVSLAAWGDVSTTIINLQPPFNQVILKIFYGIDPSQSAVTQGTVAMIITLINVITVMGVAYILFALIGAFKGSGGP